LKSQNALAKAGKNDGIGICIGGDGSKTCLMLSLSKQHHAYPASRYLNAGSRLVATRGASTTRAAMRSWRRPLKRRGRAGPGRPRLFQNFM
jgi:hypothetical protein